MLSRLIGRFIFPWQLREMTSNSVTIIWDRKKLDAAFEALPDDDNNDNPWNGVMN